MPRVTVLKKLSVMFNQLNILKLGLNKNLLILFIFNICNIKINNKTCFCFSGYCFSASLPPLLATAAIASLDLMKADPTMFINLKTKCKRMHETLEKLVTTTKIFHLVGDAESPVKHLNLIYHQYEYLLTKIVDYVSKIHIIFFTQF